MTRHLPPRAAYDRWAASYALSGRNPITDAAERALRAVMPALAGQRVLDVGCGDGRWSRAAQAQGAALVVGVDFSAGMLATARHQSPGLPLAAADMRALPFEGAAFTVVLHALALGHVDDPDPALRAVARVLAPGGRLALVDLHPQFARRGWQRTFRTTDGTRYAVNWFAHDPAAVESLCTSVGLMVECLVERPLESGRLPPGINVEPGEPVVYALRAVRVM